MRILLLNHEYPPVGGGAGNASAHLAADLVQLGCEITVITAAVAGMPAEEKREGVVIHRVGAIRRKALEASGTELVGFGAAAFRYARRFVANHPHDVLHAFFGIPSGAVCWRLGRSTGLPYLISFRGRDVHGGKSRANKGIGGWMKVVSRPVWRSAASLVANSDGLRSIALDVDSSVCVSVIPNGVDTKRFSPNTSTAAGHEAQILYVGRLEPYKGLDDLLSAVKVLADRGQSIHLTCAGDGSLRSQLPEQAARLDITDRVSFTGPVHPDAIPDLYRSADIFVLPSLVEGMPNVVLEAMASGLPVVATRIPGSEELVGDGETGYLVDSGSPESLADALEDIVTRPDRRDQMGMRGRQAAEGRSWRAAAEAYVNQYQRIVKGARLCAASVAS